MRAIVQRVSQASVTVEGNVVGEIGAGLLLLVGVHREDTGAEARKLADRVAGLRIFNDVDGKMNLALDPDSQSVLAVSNFTVYGETAKNRRPSFTDSAPYVVGQELFDLFVASLRERGVRTETGVYGADMKVALVNDGPVTVLLETSPAK